MNKNMFTLFGWISLIGIGIAWLSLGYSNWYLLQLLLTYLFFSLGDGSIKKLKVVQSLSPRQIAVIIVAFAASVAIVFVLIQGANYVINDLLQLSGGLKTFTQFAAIILFLYPARYLFDKIIRKTVHL